jgi:TPR repeat protein
MNKRLLFAAGAALTLCFAPNLRAENTDEKFIAENPVRRISLEVQQLERKANDGSAKAQFKLAEMYEQGRGGLARNQGTALSWYEEAARNGNSEARKRLRAFGSVE